MGERREGEVRIQKYSGNNKRQSPNDKSITSTNIQISGDEEERREERAIFNFELRIKVRSGYGR
jgi:hypothetical protein